MGDLLQEKCEGQENVSVRRKLNHMYSVTGSNGELPEKISRDSLMSLLDIFLEGRAGIAAEAQGIIQTAE